MTAKSTLHICFLFAVSLVVLGADQFQNDALSAHNQFRAVHGVNPLTMNEEMNAEATAYAQKLANTQSFEHSNEADNPNGDGENLLSWPKGGVDGYSGTQIWYDEVKDYDWNNPSWTQAGDTTFLLNILVHSVPLF